MSVLTRLMNTTQQILDEHDAKRLAPSPYRPPIFVRTNYLFVEIDEALATAAALTTQIKIARIENSPARARELNKQLLRITRQAAQMAAWVEDQFQKDFGNADRKD